MVIRSVERYDQLKINPTEPDVGYLDSIYDEILLIREVASRIEVQK